VDKKNPVSAKAYEKVGYQIVGDNYEYIAIPAERNA
jgi:predicted GNAT family acetyltransferase